MLCNLDEDTTKRILRHACAKFIFKEQPKGIIKHNAASRSLAENPMMRQFVGMVLGDLWPAATRVGLLKWAALFELTYHHPVERRFAQMARIRGAKYYCEIALVLNIGRSEANALRHSISLIRQICLDINGTERGQSEKSALVMP